MSKNAKKLRQDLLYTGEEKWAFLENISEGAKLLHSL